MLSKQLLRELEEIKVVELYRAYHESIHMERHHVYATDNSLCKRLAKFPINPEEPLICSKFTIPMQEIVDAIYECIKKNLKDLEKWDPYKEDRILNLSLGKVIGYGYVQRTDTTHPFQMSAIRVILAAPKKKGRYFAVKTAYPVPDMDEIDIIWDAKDEYEDKLRSRRLKEKDA